MNITHYQINDLEIMENPNPEQGHYKTIKQRDAIWHETARKLLAKKGEELKLKSPIYFVKLFADGATATPVAVYRFS